MVGGGRGYEKKIREEIKKLDLEDFVIQTGHLNNNTVISLLDHTDVFCLPSSKEGLPLSILEAMKKEKAVVTTNISGMKEFFTHEKNALLSEIDDIDGLTKNLERVLFDDDLKNNLGFNAKKLIQEKLNWVNVAEQYLEVFKNEKEKPL